MTSHDVVNRVRRIYRTKKAGHTGTLDPDAVGVLPVCVGQATRLVEYLAEKDKTYKVLLRFGCETDTQDASGAVTASTALPELTREQFCAVTERFVGTILQTPPRYSALKKGGEPLYKLARRGVAVEAEPRAVEIYGIRILLYQPESAMLEVHCGKGTYVRTLCQDIGRACGSSAYLAYLLRTQSGAFRIEDAVQLERLEAAERPEEFLLPMRDCLPELPLLEIKGEEHLARIQNGMARSLAQLGYGDAALEGVLCRAVTADGELLAVGRVRDGAFRPGKVFATRAGQAVCARGGDAP